MGWDSASALRWRGTRGGHVAPTLPRLALTGAYDSAGDGALVTALAASSAGRTRPMFTVPVSSTRTIAFQVAAVAAPGGLLSWVGERAGYTAAVAESFDSTNGADGTWTALSPTNDYPSGSNNAERRQVCRIAAGAARWVRLAVTIGAAGSCNVHVMIHQRPAAGPADIWLVMGASLEDQSSMSRSLENAMIAAYPDSDPMVFSYSRSGQTSATILSYVPLVDAAFGDLYDHVYLGHIIGNDITAAQPISDDTAQSLIDLRGRVDDIIAGFAGKAVFMARHTYREYTGLLPTAQGDGSLPYMTQVLEPAILANVPAIYDTSLSIPRLDLYSASIPNRAYLNSAQHYDDYGWYRAELARTIVRHARTGTWPPSFVETQVQKVEATGFAADRYELDAMLASLPASAARTALAARAAAAAVSPSFVDNFSGTGGANLNARNADTGEAWTALDGTMLLSNNKPYPSAVTAIYRSAWTPASAEYDATAEILFKTVLAQNVYLLARCVDASNFYYAGVLATGNWVIGRCVAGAFTTILTGASAGLAANRSYQFLFRVRDGAKSLFIDGVQVATTSDNSFTSVGGVGIRVSGVVSTTTTGVHFDRVMANNP